jgi:RNA polymerase sigma-70 factor, ECF subfamily
VLTLLRAQPQTTVDTRPVNGRTRLVLRHRARVGAVITLDPAPVRTRDDEGPA